MISNFSVKKSYTVFVGVVMVIILGIVSFTRMTTDLLPSINLPYVMVMTTYAGASPEMVETVVTKPIESAMVTVSNIENVSSTSNENYSMVVMEFAQSTEMDAASLEIREKLDQLKSYWDDSVGNPVIMKLNPDMLPIMVAAVGMEGYTNAQISDLTQNSIIPELESIEGVASVSGTGLVEESVNVMIRKDKIDKINEQVFGYIDSEMAEQEEELADGKKEIQDNRADLTEAQNELNDSRQEIAEGKTELEESKKDLESGKQELESKKTEASQKLAETETQLLTAKANLEAAKINITTQKTMVEKLQEGLNEAENQKTATLDELAKAEAELNGKLEEVTTAIEGLAAAMEMLSPFSGQTVADVLAALDSLGLDDATKGMIQQTLGSYPGEMGVADIITSMNDQKVELENARAGIEAGLTELQNKRAEAEELLNEAINKLDVSLKHATLGMDVDPYIQMITAALPEIESNLEKVNQGLTELYKGNLKAATEFANAQTKIDIGELQMNTAQAQMEAGEKQLESGQDQIDTGLGQLNDALDQLKDGEEQLEEAKEDAYASADMNDILTVETVKSLLAAQNFSMPGGYVTEEGVEYLVRVGDKPGDVEALSAMPIMNPEMDGVEVITLGDVADVFMTDNSKEVYTNVNGSPGVLLTVQKQTGYSTGDVSDKLIERFSSMAEENPDLNMITLMDQGIYIDFVMDSIINNVLFGSVLAIFILILFLKDLRPTFVIACSIPISLVAAIVCMFFSGVTLNVISLSGLALGVGMLVDNSIVVIENIYRMRSLGVGMKEAAIEGAREVSGAIMASTLTTVCVFLPIVFTEGITRQLFVDMGLTIAYSLLTSLLIALTVVPAMASKLLTKAEVKEDDRLLGGMILIYEKLLRVSLKIKPVVLLLVVALLGVSAAAAFSKGTAFMPEMESTQATITVTLPEGTLLEETGKITDDIVERLRTIEDVVDAGAMAGGSGNGVMMPGNTVDNATDIYLTLREDKVLTGDQLAARIQELTADIPEAELDINMSTMDMSALGGSGISIQIRGRELDTLQKLVGDIAVIVGKVEGTTDVSDGMADSTGELRVLIDRDKAIEYGLTVAQVFQQISVKLTEASSATSMETEIKEYDVYIKNAQDMELTRETIKNMNIDVSRKDGTREKVLLSSIADFEQKGSPSGISRTQQTRYMEVTAGIAEGYNIGIVAQDLQKELDSYPMPAGYQLVMTGENETINDAMEQVMLMLLLAVLFMYLIMVAQFQSLLSPFIIMFTIPLAFTGGLLGLYFSGSEVSVIALIGFVMLSGIIVNNGIVLVDYINQLRGEGMEKKEAIIEAGRTRLRPVLMTALTTILALSTMVFSNDMGAELSRPMAVVTIGGLVYGTLLTLIVVPCIYDIFMREKKEKGAIDETVAG